jgi:hypothetical protein
MGEPAKGGGQRPAQRRYAPKTKTGCTTCKIRRVKCDEHKPHCHRCTSTGRRCDGYPTPSTALEPATSKPGYAITDPSIDLLERKTFDFFRTETVPCISGYFDDPVWGHLVLQVSQCEPTVRAAVNALGSLHYDRHLHSASEKCLLTAGEVQTGYTVTQYGKALHGLQSLLRDDKVSTDLVLTTALLMAHFEALRENFVPALMHVESSINILQATTKGKPRNVDLNLVRTLMRLDIQGSTYLGTRMPGLALYTLAMEVTIPATLQNLSHARDVVNAWTCRMFHFIRGEADYYKFENPGDVPLEVIARSQTLTDAFVELDGLLWTFMHRPTVKLSIREQFGLGVLRARVKFNKVLVACSIYAEATMYDKYLAEFEDILIICTHIMNSDIADKRLFSVSLDEGLLHPLFFVATHCRDGRIRHIALDQLKKLPTNRGIWHIEAMTRTAEMCIEMEEAEFDGRVPDCADIPEWKRIHSSGFEGWDLGPVKPKVTAHFRVRRNGMDGEFTNHTEVVEWVASIPKGVHELYSMPSPYLGPLKHADGAITWWEQSQGVKLADLIWRAY